MDDFAQFADAPASDPFDKFADAPANAPQVPGEPVADDPIHHAAFEDRARQANPVDRVLSNVWDVLKDAYTNQAPLGIQPGGEADQWFIQHGVFRNPQQQRYGDTLRQWNELVMKGGAASVDMLGRLLSAGTSGLGEALTSAVQQMGAEHGTANDIGRELTGALDLEIQTGGANGFARMVRGPDGIVRTEPIGNRPTHDDFETASRALPQIAAKEPANVEGEAPQIPLHDPAIVTDKVRSLYEQYGIHPSEVLADAVQNPELARDIVSDSPILPTYYTGFDPLKATADQILSGGSGGRGAGGGGPPRDQWPETPDLGATPRAPDQPAPSRGFVDFLNSVLDRFSLGNTLRDLQIKTVPMAARDATMEARSAAKDFANGLRTSRYDWQQNFDALTNNFTPEELEHMWNRMDAESVADQLGRPHSEIDIPDVSPAQRAVMQQYNEHAAALFEDAKRVGIVRPDAKPLPSYVPRMIVRSLADAERQTGEGNALPINSLGRNLRITTPQLMRRKYLTSAETEEAAQAGLEDGTAHIVRDFRVLPLAMSRLQDAIAGRALINRIREVGETQDEATVFEGSQPESQNYKYFTIDHPAFKSWRPRWSIDPDTGSVTVAKDADGNILFDRVPLFVRSDFEGPLRAVLSQPEGAAYRAAMSLKARATQLIMFSPLLHNQVIFGRVLGGMHGNPFAALKLYFDGNKLKADDALMHEALGNGLAPIGRFGARQDISSITADPNLLPGQGMVSQILGHVGDIWSPRLGDAVRRKLDSFSDLWHNTLLWDRVGDMQLGMYKHVRDDMIERGFSPSVSARTAAHLANRFAGSIPVENMSQMARKTANALLFSRSFTLGNVGAIKDMVSGLPRDIQAQIERDEGIQSLNGVQSVMQRKAIGIFLADSVSYLGYASLLATTLAVLRKTMASEDTDKLSAADRAVHEEAQGYADRFYKTAHDVAHLNTLNPYSILNSLTPMSENEEGRQSKILIGYLKDGTAQYMNLPLGKVPEEMNSWLTHPAQMVSKKLSTLARPIWDIWENKDFSGKAIYNLYPNTPEDYLVNAFKMAQHFVAAQFPEDTLSAAYDLLHGTPTDDEKAVDVWKIFGPLTGFTMSRGYPGGPVGSEVAKQKAIDQYNFQQQSTELRSAIKEGRIEDAQHIMEGLRMDPKFQAAFIKSTLNPSLKFVRKQMQKWISELPDDERERVQKMIGSGQ
jgi:hypothetical protein